MTPDGYNAEILKLLKSIDARVAKIEAAMRSGAIGNTIGGGAADDRELDSQYGNPNVKKDPKRWIEAGGDSYIGMPMSHCPPEYLDSLADLLEWKASRPIAGKEKYAAYDKKDAARARGWAKRLRSGWKPATPAPETANGTAGYGSPPDVTDFGSASDFDDVPF